MTASAVPAVTRRLRVGVLLSSTTVNAWEARVLEDVRASRFAEIVFAAIDDRVPPPRFARLLRRQWSTLLYDLYERIDRRMYGAGLDPFARADVSPLIAGAAVFRMRPIEGRYVDRFTDGQIAQMQAADLDVLLRFGFRIIKGDVLHVARYGVWSYHHGDNRQYRGGPPMFWEIAQRNPTTGSILQILGSDLDAGHVIYRSWSSTDVTSLSRNRRANYWKTAAFVIRCLRDLHRDGAAALDRAERGALGPVYKRPRALTMLRFLIRHAALYLQRRIMYARADEQWFIAVRERRALPFEGLDPERWRLLVAPPERFFADPILHETEARTHLFFEDYRYREAKAVISAVEVLDDGTFSAPFVVLERPYHLSYPFVFTWEGEQYMIPETSANRSVELYRATRYPHDWELERVLLTDTRAVDATLIEHDGRWWMFAAAPVPGASANDELCLYHAPSPLGPWTPHLRNPVISDVRRARPAGPLFRSGGSLIRPSQDSSVRYGYAVNFNRVLRLTASEYEEEQVGRAGPEWRRGNLGTHSYTATGRFEAVDGRVVRRRWRR